MSPKEIQSPYLTTVEWFKKNHILHWAEPLTTSTNQIAKTQLGSFSENKFFVTDHQTAGRGRNQNSWSDVSRTQLMMTTAIPLKQLPPLWTTLKVGSDILNSVKDAWHINAQLKAPNDIFMDDKKMIGILTEVQSSGSQHWLLVGFGFNVMDYPKQFAATALARHVGESKINDIQWDVFLNSLVNRFAHLSSSLSNDSFNALLQSQLKKDRLFYPGLGLFLEFVGNDKLRFQEKIISWSEL